MEFDLSKASSLIPLAIVLLTGVGYLIRRRLTGQQHRENEESIERAVRLKRLLTEDGMTIEEAIALRDRIRAGRSAALKAAMEASIDEDAKMTNDFGDESSGSANVPFEETNLGMRQAFHENLKSLEAQLEDAVADLGAVTSEARAECLKRTQRAWEAFRESEAEFSALLYEGGSGAPLLATARKVELTEQRLAEVKQARAEIATLMGR